MQKIQFLIFLAFLYAAVIFGSGAAIAQDKKINWNRMQRDLDIMEGILDEIMSSTSYGHTISSGNARGLYFSGYGVVFQIGMNGGTQFLDIGRLQYEEALQELAEMFTEAESMNLEAVYLKPEEVSLLSNLV